CAAAESWLPMIATTRKTNSATQFCGSAIMKVVIGGKKKKFRQSVAAAAATTFMIRSEEHTSELHSPCNLVCRLLLEKKKPAGCAATSCRSAGSYSPRSFLH